MKVQKTISIDYELSQKLRKEENASELINSLLIKYYKGKEVKK